MKNIFLTLSLSLMLVIPAAVHAQNDTCKLLNEQFEELGNLAGNAEITNIQKELTRSDSKIFPHFCSPQEAIVWFIQGGLIFAASAAIIFIIIGGFQIIIGSRGGEAESVAHGKKTVLYAILGLIVIMLASGIVTVVARLVVKPSL